MDIGDDVSTGYAEPNKEKQVKFLIDLCNAFKKERLENLTRYYAALYLLDKTGNGWVYADWYISHVSSEFHVQHRQVKKQINTMSELRMVDIVRDRIYYRNQEKVIDLLGGKRTTDLAIRTRMSDLRNGVRARSHFHAGRLQAKSSGEVIMISRQWRRNVVDDRAPQTQRKYDKLQGVTHQSNFAIVSECNQDSDFAYWDDAKVLHWKERIGDKFYYVRRISNLYILGKLDKVGIRKRPRNCLKTKFVRDPKSAQFYYDKLPKKMPDDRDIYIFKEHISHPFFEHRSRNLWEMAYHVV